MLLLVPGLVSATPTPKSGKFTSNRIKGHAQGKRQYTNVTTELGECPAAGAKVTAAPHANVWGGLTE